MAITLKIHEVNAFLVAFPDAQKVMREVHPEACFRMLGGNTLSHPKRKAAGFDERNEILAKYFSPITRITRVHPFHEIRRQSPKIVANDDINDALAAALTAKLGKDGGLKTLPPEPPKDKHNQFMEMGYFYPTKHKQPEEEP